MTTIVADRAAVFTDTALERHPYFSWGAAIAGGLAAAVITFMLLAIGAGLGLVLVGPVDGTAPVKTILTLGGIYFFAVEAFGFAVGGYIAGRMCGPVLQSREEEIFRSGVHGLVAWALSAALCIAFLTVAAAIATAAAGSAASVLGLGSAKEPNGEVAPATTAYWADVLLRAPAGSVPIPIPRPGTEAGTEATTTAPTTEPPASEDAPAPAPDLSTMPPQETAPPEGEGEPGTEGPANGDMPGAGDGSDEPAPNDDELPPSVPSPALYVPGDGRLVLTPIQATLTPVPQITTITASRRIDPDARAEIARILAANALTLDKLPADDRRYIERTIVEQTGVSETDARQRVDALISRVRDDRRKAAEIARKAAAYLHIWMGLALLFGLLVATAAAVLARLEDEKKREEPPPPAARVEPAITA